MSKEDINKEQRQIKALLSDYVHSVQIISEHIISIHNKLESLEKQVSDLKVIKFRHMPKRPDMKK